MRQHAPGFCWQKAEPRFAPPLVDVPVPCAVAVPPVDWVVVPVEPPDDVAVPVAGVVAVEAAVLVLAVVAVPVELDDEELDGCVV